MTNRAHYNVLEQIFPVKRLIGRNREMYEIFKILKSEQKFVHIYGSSGVGKTALVKQAANYLYARNCFRFMICTIMMENISTVSYFKSELFKTVELAYDFKSFCQTVKQKECLFILEKCDSIIERNKHDFVDFLNEVSEHTKRVKFILVTNHHYGLNLRTELLELGNLCSVEAAKLLLVSVASDKLPWRLRNIENLRNTELFQRFKDFSPHAIWWISHRLNQCGDFEQVQKEMLEKHISAGSEIPQAIEDTLR